MFKAVPKFSSQTTRSVARTVPTLHRPPKFVYDELNDKIQCEEIDHT